MSCDNVITVQDLETDKKHSTFYREVITGKAGGTGADIDSATNPVTGQTQATLPKVLSNVGFSPAGFDFTTGGTLTERDKAIFYQADGNWYSWGGTLPKVVPPASSPLSTGGIADNAWNVSTSAFMYRDWEGFTAELLSQAGIEDDGQPDEIGNSQRVDAISKICGRQFANVMEMLAFDGLKAGVRYSTGGTVWECLVDGASSLSDFDAITAMHCEDFGLSEDAADNSPAVLLALSALGKNGKLVSNGGDYKMLSEIDFTFGRDRDGCCVELRSNFIFESQNGFIFRDKQQGRLDIGRVAYKSLVADDINFSQGRGIQLKSFWTVDVNIDFTQNFKVGTALIGGDLAESGNGAAFNNFYIKYARAPISEGCYGCLVTTEPYSPSGKGGYFNGNRVFVGFARGHTGLKIEKGINQSDKFNGNKIDAELENCAVYGINMEFSTNNTVTWPRFEGSGRPSDKWIIEASDCSRNDFYLTTAVNIDDFSFNGVFTNVYGRIVGPGGSFIADQIVGGVNRNDATGNDQPMYVAHRRNAETKPNTLYWGGIFGQNKWQVYAGGVKDANGVEKVFGHLNPYGYYTSSGDQGVKQMPIGVSYISVSPTGTGPLTLQMNRDREEEGYSFFMKIKFSNKSLSVTKSTGGGGFTIASGETGLYLCIYSAQNWSVEKIK